MHIQSDLSTAVQLKGGCGGSSLFLWACKRFGGLAMESDDFKDEHQDSSGYSASHADDVSQHGSGFGDWENVSHVPQFSCELPFRAIDLIDDQRGVRTTRRFLPQSADTLETPGPQSDAYPPDLFGRTSEPVSQNERAESMEGASEESVELVEPAHTHVDEPVLAEQLSGPVVPVQTWNQLVASSFAQFREVPTELRFPWELGPMAAVFNFDDDPMPMCPGLAELPIPADAAASDSLQRQLSTFLMPDDAKYLHAVKSIQDMSYFDGKAQQLELACGQWLRILSVQWSASGIGPQLAEALQRDSAGNEACLILKACFGVKSPSTLLKRAGAFRKFFAWHQKSQVCRELGEYPLPLSEVVIWEYFLYLKQLRVEQSKGYTVTTSFLEAVRFAKFTLDLQGTECVLGSRRLLGFAALERKAKGPTVQAPGMSPEHIQRLHSVLQTASNPIDKLGAGCFLVCLYGRARWSDMRYIDHVCIEDDQYVTFYTTEHETASIGLKREQYLPIVVPWNGICDDDWVRDWLQLYAQVGLNIHKRPLGPLLPAPRTDGSFCARPLSTSEAAGWLRALLQGTTDSETFRSHSLKATLLMWVARAGFDKETRAVLGHHASAVSGSEVVYSRQLQTRALRKLSLVLRGVRAGLSIEDENMKDFGLVSTPVPFTPAMAAQTPVAPPVLVQPVAPLVAERPADGQAVDAAVEEAVQLEELQSAKEEDLGQEALEAAAQDLTLFPIELVTAGVVEIESSSGSDSDSSTSSSQSDSSSDVPQAQGPRVIEDVPDGLDYHRHVKSGLVHKCKAGELVTGCKIHVGANYKKLARRIYVVHPKCIRCFPKDNNRIRSCEQMAESLDGIIKRSRLLVSKDT